MKKRVWIGIAAVSMAFAMLLCMGCTSEEKTEPAAQTAPAVVVKESAKPISLQIDAANAKYWYVSGTEPDTNGLTITASMSDGSTKQLDASECTFEMPIFRPAGEKNVTVHYGELTAEYPIYTCPVETETDWCTTYLIRKYDGKKVTLTASLVGEDKPFVLLLPGGQYTTANYNGKEGYGFAQKINALGYNAFILQYTTQTVHPAPLDDVNTAYDIIEQNRSFFHTTMENYAVCGSSSGGHLAGTWCTQTIGYAHYGKPRPAALIMAYPVVSFTIMENCERRRNLAGENPSAELLSELSIDENVDAAFPPTFVWIFVEDALLPGVERLEQSFVENSITNVTHYYHGGAHGLGLAAETEAEGWMEEAIAFWQEQMR